MQDEARTEEADQADERLAALVRQQVPSQTEEEELQPTVAALEPDTISAEPSVDGYEPLATFDEPVASLLDIITAEPASQLVAADSVSEYIARLQAGQNPPCPRPCRAPAWPSRWPSTWTTSTRSSTLS
ncbi:hypothetical protein ACFQT0_27700 [Hymenobacter humi]|uniref:Uncharacterized protein n=1 Tax=Hymenobacter humi TaxID=1411620 RepID=A0ABW2UB73_9BACT